MKNVIEKTLLIDEELNTYLQEILDIEKGYCKDYGSSEIIHTLTINFGNGIEADIQVCNGDTPYIDSVLFDNGYEVVVLDVSETLLGEYYFEYGYNVYIAKLDLK